MVRNKNKQTKAQNGLRQKYTNKRTKWSNTNIHKYKDMMFKQKYTKIIINTMMHQQWDIRCQNVHLHPTKYTTLGL